MIAGRKSRNNHCGLSFAAKTPKSLRYNDVSTVIAGR